MSADDVSNDISEQTSVATTRGHRIEAAVVLLVAVAVLVLARIMQPSPQGFGTHEQFFLIPCAFRWLTGLPCPMCGMTTAFTLMARGEALTALGTHVLGPALYLATWGMAGMALAGLVRGTPPIPRWLAGARGARVVMLLIGAGWLVNIALHLFRT